MRQYWSLRRYNFVDDGNGQGRAAAGGLQDDAADADIVDRMVKSAFFWAYLNMARKLCCVISHLLHWAESCSCHADALRDLARRAGYSYQRKTSFFQKRYGEDVRKCPLAGCRSADWANGKWFVKVAELFRTSLVEINFEVPAEIDGPGKAGIVRDFESARSHIVLQSKLKFVSWEHLPLKLCGLCDTDLSLARRCAEECIMLWEGCAHQHHLHYLCQKVMRPGPLRDQLERFAAGGDITDPAFAKLRRFFGRFTLVGTCERAVEGLHAELKKHIKLAPNHTPCFVAVKGCARLMIRSIQKHPRELKRIGNHVAHTSVRNAVVSLGFADHPVIRNVRAIASHRTDYMNREGRAACVDVIYHCDRQTLCESREFAEIHGPGGGGPGGGGGAGGPGPGGGGGGGDDGRGRGGAGPNGDHDVGGCGGGGAVPDGGDPGGGAGPSGGGPSDGPVVGAAGADAVAAGVC